MAKEVMSDTGAAERRKLSPKASEVLAQRDGPLPVWIRVPARGPEHYTGFSRAKLYELAAAGKVRSVSIREPGQIKGTRLFNLQSVLDFIGRHEKAAA